MTSLASEGMHTWTYAHKDRQTYSTHMHKKMCSSYDLCHKYITGVCKSIHRCFISFRSVWRQKGHFSVRYFLETSSILFGLLITLYITAFQALYIPWIASPSPTVVLYKYLHLVILEFLIDLLKKFDILKHRLISRHTSLYPYQVLD